VAVVARWLFQLLALFDPDRLPGTTLAAIERDLAALPR
jgi:hypothetical protein